MPESVRKRFRFSFPLRVFVAGCVVSVVAALVLYQWLRMATVMRIDDQAGNVEAKINARLAGYVAVLRGAAGLCGAEPWVSRDKFHRYIQQLDVDENYPGVQGVGLSVRVLPEEADSFVSEARREGWPNFHIWPTGPRPVYHAILYLEPEDVRNLVAIGYDMHTESVRAQAMDRARDSGKPTATGKVTLVQEIDTAKQAGFLIYFPFYAAGDRPTTVAERQHQLAGYSYAPFRAGDFLGAIISRAALHDVKLSVYDGVSIARQNLLFEQAGTGARDGVLPVVRSWTLRVAGRPWTLVYAAEPRGLISPLVVLVLGAMLSGGAALLLTRAERASHRAERSEAARREREGELALLVDAVPALVAYIDRNGVYRLCNRRYASLFDCAPEALVGRSVEEVVGAEAFGSVRPHFEAALAGRSVEFERWYKVRNAGVRYLGTIYAPLRADNGEVLGIYALTSDLTAHKRAEESALFVADCGKLLIASMDVESTARGVVHLAVPRVADVAVLFRAEGEQLVPTAVAHVDATAEQALAQFLETVRIPQSAPNNVGLAARTGMVVVSAELNEEDLERAAANEGQRAMLRALQLRSALHIPVVVRGRVWAVFSLGTAGSSGRPFTDEHRQLAEEISTRVRLAVENALLYREAQQEIDERRRAERVTRETEEHFRLLVDGVSEYAIMSLDAQGRVTSWNEGAQRILGFTDEEAVGRSAAEFFLPEDRETGVPEQELARARERGADSGERWYARKDGSRFWASSHTAVLRHEDGAIRGFARIMRDLTDRKRMEEELERRVQARTLELAEAVQELEAFSYSVSHDLRAPLRTIRGFTELALEEADGRLNESERGYLDRVQRASARLDRLISDLLAYTRVSKTKVELRRIALHSLVSDIQREHPEFQLPRADVRIVEHLLPVVGNEAYLTQCLTNLLGNAVKFVEPGRQPVVRIWTERHGDRVRLFVQDNGIGIPPERQARAFEMFERLHTNGTYEGTGVGLAIVRRAVQRMRGDVGVSSEEGGGTTFWIELPAAEGEPRPAG